MPLTDVDVAPNSVAERLQRSRLGPPVRTVVSVAKTASWARNGCPAPAPPHVKRAAVREAVRRHGAQVFVETGTYRGDTLAMIAPLVSKAISIELDHDLAEQARRRFRSMPNVEILQGDSASELSSVVQRLDGPALFWLDGHYSGGATANSGQSPILDELDAILTSPHEHVVLIDDMRLFDGTDGYPDLRAVRERITRHRPQWELTVANDIGYAALA